MLKHWSRRPPAETRAGPGADLRSADLRGADLSGRSLGGARLDGADLRGARLDGADLRGARLCDARLDGASLRAADLTGADLRRTTAPGARAGGLVARNARWDGAEWRGADLDEAVLEDASARGARFDRASLRGASLGRARVERAVFDGAVVEGLRLEAVHGRGSAWTGAGGRPLVTGGDYTGADLRGAAVDAWARPGVKLGGVRLHPGAAARHAEALAAAGRPLTWGERWWGPQDPVARAGLPAADPRRGVVDATRLVIRDRARRRALADRLERARGVERAAAAGAVLVDRARTWQKAVVGPVGTEERWRPPDAGLDFEEESGRRAEAHAAERATLDNEARARARSVRARSLRVARETREDSGRVEREVAARRAELERLEAARLAAVEAVGVERDEGDGGWETGGPAEAARGRGATPEPAPPGLPTSAARPPERSADPPERSADPPAAEPRPSGTPEPAAGSGWSDPAWVAALRGRVRAGAVAWGSARVGLAAGVTRGARADVPETAERQPEPLGSTPRARGGPAPAAASLPGPPSAGPPMAGRVEGSAVGRARSWEVGLARTAGGWLLRTGSALLVATGRGLVLAASALTAAAIAVARQVRWAVLLVGGPVARSVARWTRRAVARAAGAVTRAARAAVGAPPQGSGRLLAEDAGDFRVESARRDRERAEAGWVREVQARRAARVLREAEARRAAVAAGETPAPDLGERVLLGVRRLRAAFPAAEEVELGPGVELRGRQLDERHLAGLDLSGADLEGAGLVGADLRGTDLRGANLRGADLTAARLAGADLRGAELGGANLDQADLAGALLDGARVEGAWIGSARGLRAAERGALVARGADLGQLGEAAWARGVGWAMAAAIFVSIGVYLAARVASSVDLDAAALEHAASLAAREGDPAEASRRFQELATRARDEEQRAQFLLEATNASVEAGDLPAALELLDEAVALAERTPLEGRARLRRAQVQALAGLTEAAAEGLRVVLERQDLGPSQQAEALVGLARLVPEERLGEVDLVEVELVARAETDPQRVALGLALADGWASVGRVDRAREAVSRVLDQVDDPGDAVDMRMRLARLLSDEGDADGALAVYLDLVGLPDGVGEEARLGAAELLFKRGAGDAADTMLAPLRRGGDADLRVRAELAFAGIALRRGEERAAVAALREVLDAGEVEPRVQDEARLMLARILVRDNPEAAAELAGASPELRDELRLGQARALREAGKRQEARAVWVALAEDPAAELEARAEAGLALADLEAEDQDFDGALERLAELAEIPVSLPTRQRVQLAASNVLVLGGRLQEAEARYQALLATARGEVADQCRLGLARAAELRGQVDRASELYAEVGGSTGPWSVEALASLGRMRERLGDDVGAAAAWRLASGRPGAEVSRRTEIRIRLAQALHRLGDPEAAEVYGELLDAPDPLVRVQARMAVAAEALDDDPARARALYADAIGESEPGETRAEARAGWLRASVALGEVQAGLDRVKAWLETEPDAALRGELAVEAVRALRAEGRLADARELGDHHAVEGGFELGMERAGVLRELGDPGAAARVLDGLRPTAPEDEGWRIEALADARLAAGDVDAAEAALERLATLPGHGAAAAFGRARVARERGDHARALTLLAESDDPRAPTERALVLEGLERWEEARVAWERLAGAPDLESRSAGILGLARVALAQDDTRGALGILERLDRVDPGYALTWGQVRGEALLAAGRLDEARAVYAELDADAESRVVGALGLGECALAGDDPVSARTSFQAAFDGTEDPYYRARALAGLARALAEGGDADGARRAVDRLRRVYPDQHEAIAAASGAAP